MVSWVDERCGMEERHRWGGRGRVDGGRNRYGWAFKRHPCGGGPDARSAIGTPSKQSTGQVMLIHPRWAPTIHLHPTRVIIRLARTILDVLRPSPHSQPGRCNH